MKRIKEIYQKCIRFSTQVGEDHVGAYAAQSAFFFMLSMIPIILLLLMLVRYTPVTKADVMTAVIQVFPRSVDSLITSIVNQVYNQSMGVIPVTVIVALWSAGKGVLAVTSGLNCVYECPETRNYVFLRVRATLYTLMFLLVIVSLLILSVFGNTLNLFIADHIPFMTSLADWLIQRRAVITPELGQQLAAWLNDGKEPERPTCADCGKVIQSGVNRKTGEIIPAADVAALGEKQFGRPLCRACYKLALDAAKQQKEGAAHDPGEENPAAQG